MALRTRTNSTFSNLPRDGSRSVIQVNNQFQTADATATPQTSPLSLTTTAVFTIVVPTNATQMTAMNAADVRISEIVGMTQYDLIKANTKEVIQCAGMSNIYVRNDSSGTNNFYFKFNLT